MITKDLKYGFTTGSCAAAAAKAATLMLFEQRSTDTVSVMTPAGVRYDAPVEEVMLTATEASCAVRKPGSDDPDVTAGILIYAKARLAADNCKSAGKYKDRVIIEGGEGIGRVTKPGLDRPVGDAAINTVPRRMIEAEVRSVAEEYGYSGTISILISAPEGAAIAGKTFNPRLGIEGGISIIGTSGIVEPMSTKAIVDTIAVELRQLKEMGCDIAVVSPGNFGLDFMRENYGYDLDKAVKCSNYIGKTIDIAHNLGFSGMLLVGHAGKLVKVAGGIMNTHSAEADCRMELMAAAAARAGAPGDIINPILDCVSTDEAIKLMTDAGIEKKCFEYIMERIDHYLTKRAQDMKIGCIVYSNKYGLLGKCGPGELFEKSFGESR